MAPIVVPIQFWNWSQAARESRGGLPRPSLAATLLTQTPRRTDTEQDCLAHLKSGVPLTQSESGQIKA